MECITQEDISHKNIVFEVTESGELENNPMVRNVLRSFELLGFKLAIDDFGTGYSNLRYIRDMTFGIIKIDRMFVQNIDSNTENYSLVEYVIDMAHKLGIKVCVEGVETAEELECVKALGADCIQGYYYGNRCRQMNLSQNSSEINMFLDNMFLDTILYVNVQSNTGKG